MAAGGGARIPAALAATFDCGPNYYTYAMRSTDGRLGVRCVSFPGKNTTTAFYWYGETVFVDGSTFRNIGISYYSGSDNSTAAGYSTDFSGNGETGAPRYSNGGISFALQLRNGNNIPQQIAASGDWSETWSLNTPNWTPLGPVTQCRPYLTQLSAYRNDGSNAYQGVRCLLSGSGQADEIWFGAGAGAAQGAGSYSHLGIVRQDNTAMAADLCAPSFGVSCNASGPLVVTPDGSGGFIVSGNWSEAWH